MNKSFIRVWEEKDIKEIEPYLLIVGEIMGDCAKCKEVGLDYGTVKECPKCKTAFRYITSREATSSKAGRFTLIRRIHSKRPDLIFIDYDDYKAASGQSRAKSIFID